MSAVAERQTRRHHADDRDAEPIETLPPGRECAADGEDGDAQELEDVADAVASPHTSRYIETIEVRL